MRYLDRDGRHHERDFSTTQLTWQGVSFTARLLPCGTRWLLVETNASWRHRLREYYAERCAWCEGHNVPRRFATNDTCRRFLLVPVSGSRRLCGPFVTAHFRQEAT